jgi:hypothetical protein
MALYVDFGTLCHIDFHSIDSALVHSYPTLGDLERRERRKLGSNDELSLELKQSIGPAGTAGETIL